MTTYDIDTVPFEILYADEIAILQDPLHKGYETMRSYLENELLYSNPADYAAIKWILWEEIQNSSEISSLWKGTEDQVGELLALQEIE